MPIIAGSTRSAAGLVPVGRPADAGEEQARQRFAEQVLELRIEDRHPARAEPQGKGCEVEAALDDPGVELRLAVAAVVEAGQVDGGHRDEAGVAAEVLLEADQEHLVAQRSRSQRVPQIGPAVEARREPLDGVDRDEVGDSSCPAARLPATSRRPRAASRRPDPSCASNPGAG